MSLTFYGVKKHSFYQFNINLWKSYSPYR
jgi:hypothetical protein